MLETHSFFVERILKLSEIEDNPALQAIEIERCRRSVPYFVSTWCFTFDPRTPPKHFPFVLFPFQIETVNWLTERYTKKENGLIEKSRDLGISWMACAWTVHAWLFGNGFSALFGSRKEDLVDDGTLDSIFGKIRYLIDRLPTFLRPAIAANSKLNRYLSITHPENNNTIKGESTNTNFGRGGRSSITFVDEAAFIERSEQIYAALSDTSDCTISMSTPNGKSNMFAWLRHETKIPVLSLHWTKHPLKTREWYDAKKTTMKDWQVASELDLSYERSLDGRVHSRFDRQFHISSQPIECNPNYEQFIAWDFGYRDPTAILWGQITSDGFTEIWNCFELAGQDIDFFIPIVKGHRPPEYALLKQDEKKAIERCLAKIPRAVNLDATHYGDHSGTAKTTNSRRSCRDALRDAGIKLISTGKQTFDVRIAAVDRLLKLRHNRITDRWHSTFQISSDCERLIECLFNYCYDSDNVSDNTIRPKHDWASHMVTALEFMAINRHPIGRAQESYSQQVR